MFVVLFNPGKKWQLQNKNAEDTWIFYEWMYLLISATVWKRLSSNVSTKPELDLCKIMKDNNLFDD